MDTKTLRAAIVTATLAFSIFIGMALYGAARNREAAPPCGTSQGAQQ